jgi:hypothetical protein
MWRDSDLFGTSDPIFVHNLLRLVGLMTTDQLLKGVVIRHPEAIDINGVFKDFTNRAAPLICSVMNRDMRMSSPLFEEFDNYYLPNGELVVQRHSVGHYESIGKYLFLVLLHNGAWPANLSRIIIHYICSEEFEVVHLEGHGLDYLISGDRASLHQLCIHYDANPGHWQGEDTEAMRLDICKIAIIEKRQISLMAIKRGFLQCNLDWLDSDTIFARRLFCDSGEAFLHNVNTTGNGMNVDNNSRVFFLMLEVLEELTSDEIKVFVSFICGHPGSPCRPPITFLFFEDPNRLPTSHTCFNNIEISSTRYHCEATDSNLTVVGPYYRLLHDIRICIQTTGFALP